MDSGNSVRPTYYFLKGPKSSGCTSVWKGKEAYRAGEGLKMAKECWGLGRLSGAAVPPGVPLERAFV